MNTKEYIEMCRKAVEIQALRSCEKIVNWQDGDFFTHIGDEYPGCTHCVECNTIIKTDIWLPRQDQLQDMLDIKKLYHIKIRPMTTPMALDYLTYEMWYTVKGETMEQLWLAFVMREKYGKKWNGSDWEVKSG